MNIIIDTQNWILILKYILKTVFTAENEIETVNWNRIHKCKNEKPVIKI